MGNGMWCHAISAFVGKKTGCSPTSMHNNVLDIAKIAKLSALALARIGKE